MRGRVKKDLEALKEIVPSMGEIVENAGTDYRYRAIAPKNELAAAFAKLVDDIDYSNVKGAVAQRQGWQRADLYHDVWATLYRLSIFDSA